MTRKKETDIITNNYKFYNMEKGDGTMVNEVMDFIEKYDPEVGAAIKDEAARQRRNLEPVRGCGGNPCH
mgnify:CR=1 FL=1